MPSKPGIARLLRVSCPLLAFLALPGAADGQERVPFRYIPDFELMTTVLPKGATLEADGGASAGGGFGLYEENVGQVEGFVGVRVGLRAAHSAWLAVRSQVALTAPLSSVDGFEAADEVWGVHRLRSVFGMNLTRGRGRHGIDLRLDADVDHAGRQHAGLRDPRIGTGPYVHTELRASVAPKLQLGTGEPLVLLLPVGYRYDGITYADGASLPAGSLQTHGITAALAFRARIPAWRSGTLELVGVDYCESTLPVRPETGPRYERRIDSLDVRLLHYDATVLYFDEVLVGLNFMVGGASLRDDGAGRTSGTFIGELGTAAYTEVVGFGMTVGRRASHAPDGDRYVGDTRLELFVRLSEDLLGAQVDARLALGWLDAFDGRGGDALFRMATHLEVAWEVGLGFEVGALYLVRRGLDYGPASWSPWSSIRETAHDVSAFARWRVRLGT